MTGGIMIVFTKNMLDVWTKFTTIIITVCGIYCYSWENEMYSQNKSQTNFTLLDI